MVYKLSQGIAFYFVREGVIDETEADLYRFGVETIFCSLVDVMIVLSTGLLFHQLGEAVWYYIIFLALRRFAGGYHAKTFGACKILMALMMVSVLGISNLLKVQVNVWLVLVSVALIGWLARKCNTRGVIFSYLILELILTSLRDNLAILTMLGYIIVLFTFNIRGGEENEGD